MTQVNKVHHVHTIARAAAMLGEDEDWLRDVAIVDQEDGLIWVYGPGDESVMAFTDSASKPSPASSRATRLTPTFSNAQPTQSDDPAAYAACLRSRESDGIFSGTANGEIVGRMARTEPTDADSRRRDIHPVDYCRRG